MHTSAPEACCSWMAAPRALPDGIRLRRPPPRSCSMPWIRTASCGAQSPARRRSACLGRDQDDAHQTGFNDLLALAALNGRVPEEMVLIGVQPEELSDFAAACASR